jgi:BirA family biotin operon repressor/biotin-[acetyl-CoA-carboxylase] ligase
MDFTKNIIRLKEVDSTNTYAQNLIKNSDEGNHKLNGTVILSEFQSGGRGQNDNIWESQKGENLLLSLILIPSFLKAEDQFILSKFLSVSILRCLKIFGIHSAIKWPNDIYVGNNKIGGILIENVISGSNLRSSILGLGLNINQSNFPDAIPNPTSMFLIKKEIYKVEDILRKLLEELEKNYKILESNDFEYFNDLYLENLLRFNELHHYRINNKIITAKITGITEYGQLILENGNSKMRNIYNFKEVEYIL